MRLHTRNIPRYIKKVCSHLVGVYLGEHVLMQPAIAMRQAVAAPPNEPHLGI